MDVRNFIMLWFEFPTLLPAVYHCVLSGRVICGSDHVTMEHNQTKGISQSVIWPRGVVEYRHMTVCVRLHKHDIDVNVKKNKKTKKKQTKTKHNKTKQKTTLNTKRKLNDINYHNKNRNTMLLYSSY